MTKYFEVIFTDEELKRVQWVLAELTELYLERVKSFSGTSHEYMILQGRINENRLLFDKVQDALGDARCDDIMCRRLYGN